MTLKILNEILYMIMVGINLKYLGLISEKIEFK